MYDFGIRVYLFETTILLYILLSKYRHSYITNWNGKLISRSTGGWTIGSAAVADRFIGTLTIYLEL